MSADKCLLFYDTLWGAKKFLCTEECNTSFELKEYLYRLPSQCWGHTLDLFGSHSLINRGSTGQGSRLHPTTIVFHEWSTKGAKVNYSHVEKVTFSLLTMSHRLQPYFQAHPNGIRTDQWLKAILQQHDVISRLVKWAIELIVYDVTYQPWSPIKPQVLIDFAAEAHTTFEQA